MKKISPYAFAAILTAARIFALSVYITSADENPTLTAICTVAVSLIKLPLLFLIAAAEKNPSQSRSAAKLRAVFSAAVSAIFLIMINDMFAELAQSVYPERFGKIGLTAVMLFVSAYVASMGIHGTSRSAVFSVAAFLAAIVIIFAEMRSGMQNDRINLYSANAASEAFRTCKNALAQLADVFIFYEMCRYTHGSAKKSAGLYISADILISLLFFMMSASVLGSFYPKSGYVFFTLSYCTHGVLLDRADGIFFAAASVFAMITCAALLTILKNSLGFLFKIKNETSKTSCLLACAAVLTVLNLSLIGFNLSPGRYTAVLSIAAAAVILISSAAKIIISSHKGAAK
jgi:hypothetical protein